MLLVKLLTQAHALATHARPQILSVTIELFRKRLQTKAQATVPVTLTVVEVRLSPPSPPGAGSSRSPGRAGERAGRGA